MKDWYQNIYMLKWRSRCSFLFFPSFLLNHLSIRDKKGESILESILECFFIPIRLMCTFSRGGILSCALLLGWKAIGERHILGGIRHFFMRKPCFICFTLCLVSHCLWCFELCLVSMLCCSHRIVLLCWTCIHPYAIALYWLHVWMIIFFFI